MSCKSACVCKRQRETVNDKHKEQSMSECIFVISKIMGLATVDNL